MAHLLLSAAHKSSGKTTVAAGLCRALHRRGLAVQPFKKGPDFIDPMWLGAAAGRPCHNLDFHTQTRDEIIGVFARRMADAAIGVIEGNKGLYDGLDLEGSNSNAALAKLIGAPVVLVIDTTGMTRGIAPIVLGHQAFDRDLDIAGIILNKVGGSRHEAKLRAILEHYTGVPVLGAVHKESAIEIVERHLGLMPARESPAAEATLTAIADAVAAQVDLDRVLAIAAKAKAPAAPRRAAVPCRAPDIRVAIARDSAFGFYYPGDLEALAEAGAELVFFDALRDRALPPADGVFLGGGFPETHMAELEANQALRGAIAAAVAGGLPTYAECGGLMYLSRAIRWKGERRAMAGVVEAEAVMHERPQGRGYVRLRETGAAPWRAGAGATIAAHEFHHASLENLAPETRFAFDVLRGQGIDGRHDGLVRGNLVAGFSHLRHTDATPWAGAFVDFARSRRRA
ncbi:MAG: cobyrinate a,c-diamide synthase [Alphaproteobacteria bacterium]|nr:cobyrinate a,c-diamide synthase [Alphaproteobacteria bacterium]